MRLLPVALIAATAMALFAAPAGAVVVRPDLVVTQANLVGKQYLLTAGGGTLASHDVTKNDVPKDVQSHARASKTRVELVAPGGDFIPGEMRDVPGLDAGDADAGSTSKHYRGAGGNPIGAYRVRVCADVTHVVSESDEDNNCKISRDVFFIVRTTWAGTLGGSARQPALGTVKERFNSSNAKFVFDAPQNRPDGGDGVFGYDFAGSVTYTDGGSAGGCIYSGGGTRAFGPGEFISPDTITFDYAGKQYAGSAGVDSFFYKVDVNCNGSHGTQQGPMFAINFFYSQPRPFPFGATEVKGVTSSSDQNWTWDLH